MMPLISIEEIKKLLQSKDFDLQPTQKKLCLPILQRIYHKMSIGIVFENIHINDGLLINGHRRYLCSLLLKKSVGRNVWAYPSRTNIYKWAEIEIDLNDWESAEIIQRHNMKDATMSGIDINSLDSLN